LKKRLEDFGMMVMDAIFIPMLFHWILSALSRRDLTTIEFSGIGYVNAFHRIHGDVWSCSGKQVWPESKPPRLPIFMVHACTLAATE